MTLALISTSCRYTQPDQPSGRLLIFDVEKKSVIKESEIIEPPYREDDPNPRGGFRGLKGISFNGTSVALANASTVFVYDQNWNPQFYVWHPSCSGIHDIEYQAGELWITSSRNDLLICLDPQGRISKYFDIRTYKGINRYTTQKMKPWIGHKQIMDGKINFRDPKTHDHVVTDRLHINSLAFLDNGDILVSCGLLRVVESIFLHELNNRLKRSFLSDLMPNLYNQYQRFIKKSKKSHFEAKTITKSQSNSVILRINPEGQWSESLVISGCTVPSHSIRMLSDKTAIYLNSSTGELIHFKPDSGTVISISPVGNKFLRGARELPDRTLLLGDNNDLIHFDLYANKILFKKRITNVSSEAVFDINILPEGFGLPPTSFIDLHKKNLPVNQNGV